ncbi:unnamed protein product [Rotaria magnacalcarata]|uniref:Uncharacterized protein n=2 Tax=Rotaria magnacalcarata TaxID=392030 RepID=A0A816KVA0_9BILA|nr:unnamed protein product [Rotaria magnacalcarata]CAF1947071.1 unnamed protein product [Rotaria magnacalcarata]
MRFYPLLLLFFSHHQFTSITIVYSVHDYDYFNHKNSSINIDLYQCEMHNEKFTTIANTIETIGNNLTNSCNVSCCVSNRINETNSSNTCQVTVQSLTGLCLSRLCYSNDCYHYSLLLNNTYDNKIKNKTTIIDQIRSSFSYIRWSSLINAIQTKWSTWIESTGLTIRDTILVILSIVNVTLTVTAMIVVMNSIRQAKLIDSRKSYRYTLL